MRAWTLTGYLIVGLLLPVAGQELELEKRSIQEEALPAWDDDLELLKAVERGDVVLGSSLMGALARKRLFSGEEGPIELHEVAEVEEGPRVIGPQFRSLYFRESPSGYLMDPQDLLTPQEKRDREGFFSYHAKHSTIDIFFYLFDTLEKIPEEETPERVMADHLQDRGSCVVVFYDLGMPERSQIAFSPLLDRLADTEEKQEVLLRSIKEASGRASAIGQIESFSVQLSISLYSIDEQLGGLKESQSRLMHPLIEEERVIKIEAEGEGMWKSGLVRVTLATVGLLFLATGGGFLMKWLIDRKRIYVFPDAEGNLLLDAPHAAGVGALITYDSPSLPPSLQRDKVPDYLQRM